ncbi:MAG: type III pantothenate kinase [Deltaproteobacteria bacterium]|nr:type III pantothenate kinase [Deltaproteobacteria bacterium]MCL5892984.1 type III pantothenate kinase [Deltaproteobacteria bacterium]
MLLACDIGNSSSVFGIFDTEGNIVKTFRVNTSSMACAKDLNQNFSKNFDLFDLKDMEGISISSVVPSVDRVYKDFFKKFKIDPLFISSKIKLNIRICAENPERLGSDRIADISYAHFTSQKFQIVVDLGTALTIDAVNEKGDFLGGIIFPGLPSLAACLHRSTEKLPLINITKNTGKPQSPVGINTEMSIMSGVYYGTIFLIEGFIENICDYYNCDINNLNVIFTGGYSGLIFDDTCIKAKKILDEYWTLKGIKYLYDLNLNR